ncbi:RsmB/NOP family class I SAM-dependent RNA methyltransferase [Henriciella aquimarina]|uniref:RsmB/NOP family class I SAM-dependent RNA methyltransferase n=1 Tax=Henriciella aquimarina TaxID=545261 RepID=UPI0009FD13A3|nr:transcription antitermination factor NusB [Henriciella aquimarina]
MSGARARHAAANLLIETLDNRRTLDEAMETSEVFSTLKGPDRGFARAMASAALRQLGRIDKGLAPFLSRPLETATPPARALLRIGAAQAWLLETPPHAVVSETVSAAKAWPRARSAAGFLNAVLRKAVADRSHFDAAPVTAVWPDWLTVELMTSLGVEATTAMATAQTEEPELHLTPKAPAGAVSLAGPLGAEVIGAGSLRMPSGTVSDIEGYEAGDWWVQDAAAVLPAQLLDAQPGETVFDLCAAPGGKTMQLAATGASVVALDRSGARLKRVEENLSRTDLSANVEVVTAKLEDWTPETKADRILLDAPCSALGTLRRHPEGAWIKSPGDIARFPDVQARLLKAAARLLAPGGTLVYCVCTPLKREGAGVVEAVMNEAGLQRVPITPGEAGAFASGLTPEGDLLTLPNGQFGHDIFFISRLTGKS